jgi:hypothetical protein
MSGGGALAKVTVNGTTVVTATFLCQVPDKKHSVKRYVPVENLPYALCRGRPSAKALPRAKLPLPLALGKACVSCSAPYGLARIVHYST